MPHICSPRGLLRRGSTPLPAAASALISHSLAGNPSIDHPMHIIISFMLKDTELILRNEGYNILALALCIKFPEIPSLQNLTIFTLGDDFVFLKGGEYFTNNVRYHILPNRRLLMEDLMHLSARSRLSTLLHGQSLVVTENEPFSVNRVGLKILDVFTNIWMVVDEIVWPYRTPRIIITIMDFQQQQ